MTSPVPGYIAWPVLVAYVVIIVGRRWLLRGRPVDRLIDRALVVGFIGLLLREAWFEALLTWLLPFPDSEVVNLARQLSFGMILLSVAQIFGIAQLWAGADPAQTWQRQRRYDLVAVVATAVILVAGTPARHADQLIDQYWGWPAVIAWTAFYLPLAFTAILVGRISVQEFRAADDTTTWRERAVYVIVLAVAIALGFDAFLVPIMTTSEVLAGIPSADPEMQAKGWTFFGSTVAATGVVAVPLISTVVSMARWDRVGRYCRRLQPLWNDLTAAVPEVVLELPRDEHGQVEPATRLHRMTIEIRDSLLHLSRFRGEANEFATEDLHVYARNIARAIAAKAAGQPPAAAAPTGRRHVHAGPRDLTAEFQELIDLAQVWSKERHRAENPVHSHLAG